MGARPLLRHPAAKRHRADTLDGAYQKYKETGAGLSNTNRKIHLMPAAGKSGRKH
jgi:hypothetical protein